MRLLILALLFCSSLFGQTVLYQDNCELTGFNWQATWTSPNVSYVTGNSALTDLPANVPQFASATRSIAFQGVGAAGSGPERATISLPTVQLNPTLAHCFKMRVASIAINPAQNSGAGLDNQDNLRITVAYNGSSTFSPEIQINGGSDISWGYSAPGVIYRTAQGSLSNYAQVVGSEYSYVVLELPVGTSQVGFEIDVGANASGETWLMDDFQLVSGCWSPLPIVLTGYQCLPMGETVKLKWTTLSEINNDFFIIEASNDLIVIEQIAKIAGAGQSSVRLDYEFIHTDPMFYYRLSQVDYDGTVEKYSWLFADLTLSRPEGYVKYDIHGREINNLEEGVYLLVDPKGNAKKIIVIKK